MVTSLSIRLILWAWAIPSRTDWREAVSRACISLIDRARDVDTDVFPIIRIGIKVSK